MITESVDDGFGDLLGKVERERGLACAGYKQKCLRRRVAVRMRARGVDSFVAYSTLIDRDAAEFDKLVGALTVNVTSFFRNWPVWEIVAREVVPALWDSDRTDIHAWSAGCASGEEAYSLAMLFHRQAAVRGMLAQIDRVQVLGTDIDRLALAAADRAEYSEGDIAETPPELRSRYLAGSAPFTPSPGIRRLVRFARQDLMGSDYPPAKQDLIVCRNVLIYFDRSTQEQVLGQLARSLIPGGYLILGKVETLLGATRAQFVPIAQRERIFRKVS